MREPLEFLRHRWRVLASVAGGVIAGWAAAHRLLPGSAVQVGWVAFAAIFDLPETIMLVSTVRVW